MEFQNSNKSKEFFNNSSKEYEESKLTERQNKQNNREVKLLSGKNLLLLFRYQCKY